MLTVGRVSVSLPHLESMGVEELLSNLSWVGDGGTFTPVNDPHNPCIPLHRVAIIIPYR